ncbi:hypothetical protein BD408DRAFT_416847 [Parasitella parasitica]|nr:hypothetical protein BD408DRAFT_416847 [Parasitella parasitica]
MLKILLPPPMLTTMSMPWMSTWNPNCQMLRIVKIPRFDTQHVATAWTFTQDKPPLSIECHQTNGA